MKKTYIIGSIAIAIIAAASVFFACSKEKESNETINGKEDYKILGTLAKDAETQALTIKPNFDVEETMQNLERELNKDKSGEMIIVENIGFYIYEDENEINPLLQVGLYNEPEAKFENIFFELQLIETSDKATLKRYGFVDDIQYSCTCIPDARCNEGVQDPKERGCYPIKYGSRWACSPCAARMNVGSCKQTITATEVVEVVSMCMTNAVAF